jgi:translation initiation factor IF-3
MLRGRRKNFQKNNRKIFYVNERIRSPRVVVIDENGQHLGELDTRQALGLAEEKGLDLVEVSPTSQPPVCKIINYGQFLYQQSRKQQTQKARAKRVEIKLIRISFKIGKHDLELKMNQAKKFLERGDKVKVEMILKGREKQHRKRAVEILSEFINLLDQKIIIEQPLTAVGGQISTLINLNK